MLLSPLQAQELHITLLNGDCDGDNEVTLLDFGIVVNAFGSTPNDPNWDPRADLDGDLEVTLLDYGIMVRNFGAVGAEPFDPALPRQPAPSEGYALQGNVELQGWVGSEQPVRIEALREDDPEQIVYWMEVQSGNLFTLHLPQSGLWWVKVSGTENSLARCLVGQSAAKRVYLAGDAIQAFFVTPREGEAFADASYDPSPIGVSVYAQDYDWVFFYSANGSEVLSNRERTTYSTISSPMNPTLLFHWEIVSGGGAIAPTGPFSPSAVYTPPVLEPNEIERSVTLRCTITDLSLDLLRRDLFGSQITRTFRIVNRPTVHVSVAAVDARGNLLSTTPIPSGQSLASRLRFAASKRGTAWNMDSVTFTTPWVSVTMLNPSGEPVISFTTEPISREEPHRRFQFSASAVFSITFPPPVGRIERLDEKTAERLLGFDIYYLPPYDRSYTNELIDNSRGQSVFGTWDVPNWFHNRAGHWGNVIPRFNEQYTYGGVSYPVVHWVPQTLEEILQAAGEDAKDLRQDGAEIFGFFDWQGVFAPYQYAPAYRGRIYIFPGAIQAVPVPDPYGLQAGGIDLVARVVAHEFAHRDLFIAAWHGFDNNNIGPPDDWFPMSGVQGVDTDQDCLSDEYERAAAVYHFDPEVFDALHRWWEDKQGCEAIDSLADFEMYSRLYGEWNGYWVGSLDSEDWSVGGRQDYEGGN